MQVGTLGVGSIFQDRDGNVWFGAEGGGLSRVKGEVVESFESDVDWDFAIVRSIYQDREGTMWFGTWGDGVASYDPSNGADAWTKFTSEFSGVSFKTRPEEMIYRYRLEGSGEEWQETHIPRVEYQAILQHRP